MKRDRRDVLSDKKIVNFLIKLVEFSIYNYGK